MKLSYWSSVTIIISNVNYRMNLSLGTSWYTVLNDITLSSLTDLLIALLFHDSFASTQQGNYFQHCNVTITRLGGKIIL